MKGFLHHTKGRCVAVALSLSLIAAAAALVLPGTSGPLRQAGETVSRPFLRLAAAVTEKVRQGVGTLESIQSLREQNAALEETVAQLRDQAQAGALAQAENARLRALLGLAEAGRDLTLTGAWVIARAPDNWQGEVTIDQGRANGVRAGQCVVDCHGALVGRVKEAGQTWAAVTLVTDPAFRLAGQAVRSGVLGTLEGDLALLPQEKLTLASLTEADPVRVGEEVVTFAAGTGYPSGLTVGTVAQVAEDPGGLTRSAVLDPAADLGALSQVFVVTAFREVR